MKRKKAKTKVKEDNSLHAALIEKVFGNEDLLREILLRVPAKSLLKFKCVSKHWLSLISHRKFRNDHSARIPKVASAIYYYSDRKCEMLKSLSLNGNRNLRSLPDLDDRYDAPVTVVHACNGLILCKQKFSFLGRIWICNLTTNKYSRVLYEAKFSDGPVLLACISYDPAKSRFYKVVMTRSNSIEIYSSETYLWKRIQVTQKLGESRHKAYWDGSIHWIHENTHLKFDVDKETLTVLSPPPKTGFLPDGNIHYFGECGEILILVQYRQMTTLGFRILEMKKGATSWTTKKQVNLRPIIQLYPEDKEFHVLSVLKRPVEGDVVLVLAASNRIFKCDLRCKMVEVICDFEPSEFQNLVNNRNDCSGCAYHFIESLAPVF